MSDPTPTAGLPSGYGPDHPAGRHPVSTGHLVMGTAFLALAVVWALVAGSLVEADDVRWLLPLPFVLAGGTGLVALALGARRRSTRR